MKYTLHMLLRIQINLACRRHWISLPMRIVAPIFLFPLASEKGLIAFFFTKLIFIPPPLSCRRRCCRRCRRRLPSFFFSKPGPPGGGGGLGLHARARDAPHQSTDKGRSALVLAKNCMGRGQQTTNGQTSRLLDGNGPVGRFGENLAYGRHRIALPMQ